jgi:hypothetical protein
MAVSYEAELDKAAALRAQAAKIEEEAFANRPLPDRWRVGQVVRTVVEMEHCASRGAILYVHRVQEQYADTPADEYQVFWTGPKDKRSMYWTTPNDVELVLDK